MFCCSFHHCGDDVVCKFCFHAGSRRIVRCVLWLLVCSVFFEVIGNLTVTVLYLFQGDSLKYFMTQLDRISGPVILFSFTFVLYISNHFTSRVIIIKQCDRQTFITPIWHFWRAPVCGKLLAAHSPFVALRASPYKGSECGCLTSCEERGTCLISGGRLYQLDSWVV